MNDRTDDPIENELSGLAMAATVEHERSVTAEETEAALLSVRDRAATDDAGTRPTRFASGSNRIRRRSPWILIGSAAAVLALLGGGLAVVLGDGPDDRIVPGTVPATDLDSAVVPSTLPEESDPPPTAPPTSDAVDGTTDDTSTAVEPQTLSVDAANPPRLVQPVPYASLPLAPNPNGQGTEFAVGLDHVIVNQPDTGSFTIVGPDGSAREVPVEEDVSQVVSGPGPVVYGLGGPVFSDDFQAMPDAFRVVAIPFLGEREGEVVASSEVDVNTFLELPPLFFGHGSDGVIARERTRVTIIGYVDPTGAPRDSGESGEFGTPFPTYEIDRSDGTVIVSERETNLAWELDITRDIGWSSTFVGPNPVAPGAGRAIYFERIGLNTTPTSDFGTNLMPVVALMNPDGSGEWIRLPDDWDVVASDVWGTLLARFTDDSIELASLEDIVPTPEPGFDPVTDDGSAEPDSTPTTVAGGEPAPDPAQLAVPRTCLDDNRCTTLASTEDGRIVALDPLGATLQVWDAAGENQLLDQPIAQALDDLSPFLVHVGPDDVAYVNVDDPEDPDPRRSLFAIPLSGPNAGTVVERWDGLDGSGDSDLVPTPAGLASVGCCGPETERPQPDATLFKWVDAAGDVVESAAPTFSLRLGEGGNEFVRFDPETNESRAFPLPTAMEFPRGFPQVAGTEDGAVAVQLVQRSDLYWLFVDFDADWPQFRIDNGDVYYQRLEPLANVDLVEPGGTLIVSAGQSGFFQRTLDEVGEAGWPGRPTTDTSVDGWPISVDGLNEFVAAEQPFWASVPDLYAYQFTQSVDANERVTVEYDPDAGVITVTTNGLLDDSVAAQRRTIRVDVADDGLFRFVSGSASQQCARGGSDAFVSEPCP